MRLGRNAAGGIGMAGILAVTGALALGAPAAQAASAPPTSVDFTLTFSATAVGGTSVTGTGNGQANFATDQAEATLNLPGGLGPILSVLPSSLSGFTKGIAADTQVQGAVSDGTVFLTLPGLTVTKKDTIGLSFPATAVAKAFTTIAKALGDPSAVLGEIKSHAVHVKSLGKHTVDGVEASGYGVTVETGKVLGLIPGVGSAIGST